MSQPATELAKGVTAWAKTSSRDVVIAIAFAALAFIVWISFDNEKARLIEIRNFVLTIQNGIAEQNKLRRESNALLREIATANTRIQEDIKAIADSHRSLSVRLDRLEAVVEALRLPPAARGNRTPVWPGM